MGTRHVSPETESDILNTISMPAEYPKKRHTMALMIMAAHVNIIHMIIHNMPTIGEKYRTLQTKELRGNSEVTQP